MYPGLYDFRGLHLFKKGTPEEEFFFTELFFHTTDRAFFLQNFSIIRVSRKKIFLSQMKGATPSLLEASESKASLGFGSMCHPHHVFLFFFACLTQKKKKKPC